MYSFKWHISVVVSILCLATTSLAQEPWGIITGKSVMSLRSGLRFVYQQAGRKDLVAALDSTAVTNLIAGNLKGLDLARPLGCIIKPDVLGNATVVTFIPCTDRQLFVGFLERHGISVSNASQDLYSVQVPLLGKIAMTFQHQYAWFGFTETEVSGNQIDPRQMIPEQHQKQLLAMSLYFHRIPAQQRVQLSNRLSTVMNWMTGNSKDSQESLQAQVGKSVLQMMLSQLSRDAREMTASARVDEKARMMHAQLNIIPRQDTSLARLASRISTPFQYSYIPFKKEKPAEDKLLSKNADTSQPEKPLNITLKGGSELLAQVDMHGSLLAPDEKDSTRKPRPSRLRERPRRR
ncbi:MAG: hypothetical protein JNJ77_06990 [Planctomycetia bacterium]|nr:hypothetical protein [Planctomycetia bacterium]